MDHAINNALRIVTGCLRLAPVENLSVLAGIQPAKLCHKGGTLSLGHCAMEPGHLLQSPLTCLPGANALRFKSRHPFCTCCKQLTSSSDDNNKSAVHWADHQWKAEWLDNTTRPCTFVTDTGTHLPGMPLSSGSA